VVEFATGFMLVFLADVFMIFVRMVLVEALLITLALLLVVSERRFAVKDVQTMNTDGLTNFFDEAGPWCSGFGRCRFKARKVDRRARLFVMVNNIRD